MDDGSGTGELGSQNTGNWSGTSSTVPVTVDAGNDTLWISWREDNVGGLSGMIVRQTSGPPAARGTAITIQ